MVGDANDLKCKLQNACFDPVAIEPWPLKTVTNRVSNQLFRYLSERLSTCSPLSHKMQSVEGVTLLFWAGGLTLPCTGVLTGHSRPPGPSLYFQYHHYEDMTGYLHAVNRAYPDLTRLYSLGKTVKERDLWVMQVTSVPEVQLGVPHVKIVGNIHGNEAVGRELVLHMIQLLDNTRIHFMFLLFTVPCDELQQEPDSEIATGQHQDTSHFLVTSYNRNETVRWLLDNTRIHLMPSLNPDGFEISKVGRCTAIEGRKNLHGLDLNRNFPDYFRQNTLPSQPEKDAVIRWLEMYPFVLSAGLHGGAVVANYPFDNTLEDGRLREPSLTPDNDVFVHLATVYSETHPTMHQGIQCQAGMPLFENGITNGAAWYPMTGGMQDYNYVWHGCMELTLELSCCKYPPPEELPDFWEENRNAMLVFLSQAQRGVRGLVMDSLTREAIPGAQFRIDNRAIGFNTSKRGEFWRILLPGNYTLQVRLV
uniref:Peptidase M14 domain-containing protein n=1 Tax=Timema douglasi TaxID=61478 RepID=A0A7R8Z9K6_TIMDO|nr:unnamed protein product [Timema douglasi]